MSDTKDLIKQLTACADLRMIEGDRDEAEVINEAAAELGRLRSLIDDHNEGCRQSCEARAGSSLCEAYKRRRRTCPDCPKDWAIDAARNAQEPAKGGEAKG